MPIFEYICQSCHHRFEAIVQRSQRAKCPKCESKKLEQQLSRFGVAGEKASAKEFTSGPCRSCGDLRGPGSCSMD
ncbi:MAG TPA: zinc ribbon domain-containing protein [Candidatus Angelobacter sp.]|jgi:putative FmdB family regulatory protein|nr:zinc ribbon domain-containing protein [Candidatus Angelobacter sp.]